MNKKLLLPLVALAGLTIKQVYNIELSAQEIDLVVDGILALLTLFGIFMEPKGGKKK